MKILSRKATTQGGRDGVVKTPNDTLVLDMAKPEEMGGEKNTKTNPEELFAMGYSACFASSLEFLLTQSGVDFKGIVVEADASLIADQSKSFNFELSVTVELEGVDNEVAKDFVDKAKAFCPYSKAIEGNVRVHFEIL